MNPIVIGIAGGTASGKTTLADNIEKEFGEKIAKLSHDYYYKSHDELSFEDRKKLNYDHPDAFDTDMLIQHIIDLKNNKPVEAPIYSFTNHNREDKTLTIKPNKVILVEGILIFENPTLRDLIICN